MILANLILTAILLISVVVLFISIRIGAKTLRRFNRRVSVIEEDSHGLYMLDKQHERQIEYLQDRKPSLSFLDFLLIMLLITAVFYGFVQLIKRGWI